MFGIYKKNKKYHFNNLKKRKNKSYKRKYTYFDVEDPYNTFLKILIQIPIQILIKKQKRMKKKKIILIQIIY